MYIEMANAVSAYANENISRHILVDFKFQILPKHLKRKSGGLQRWGRIIFPSTILKFRKAWIIGTKIWYKNFITADT